MLWAGTLPLALWMLVGETLAGRGESYGEELVVTPLGDGKVHSAFSFAFSTLSQHDNLTPRTPTTHSTLVPPLLTSLLDLYALDSFKLTLSSGRWSPHWPPNTSATSAPSGIQLAAWLQLFDDDDDEADRWTGFKGAVSGAFCAGIAAGVAGAGDEHAALPVTESEHPFTGPGDAQQHALYATHLPRLSATCTESLTPFLALLPCASRAGVASLLNPHKLFDGDWTMIRIHVARQPGDRVAVDLEVGSVGDPVRRDRHAGGMGRRDFSMQTLYDRTLSLPCPVATSSRVSLRVPVDSLSPFQVSPQEGHQRKIMDGNIVWDTSNAGFDRDAPLDIQLHWTEAQFRYPKPLPILAPFTTRRLLKGHGQERGEIGIEVTNHQLHPVEVLWIERWPWWVRGFVGGLKAELVNQTGSGAALPSFSVLSNLSYSPPIARRRPTTLSATLLVPALASVRLLVPYESSYLWYTEYPADAHRGFEVPGAVTVARATGHQVHTPSILLSLPTPDFSMPYNVIILTSTLVALFFGSIVNPLRREWVVVDLGAVPVGKQ